MAKAGRVSPVQVGVLIVGLIAVGYLVFSLTKSGRPRLSNTVMLVDVESGKLYQADVSRRTAVIPEISPESGKETLFPVEMTEQGRWVVPERYRRSLASLQPKPAMVTDARQGVVTTSNEKPQSLTLPRGK